MLKLVPTEKLKKKAATNSKKKQWILSLIKEDFPLLLISLFLGIAISVLGISTAIFSEKLIDVILPKEDIQKLILSLVFVTLLLFIRSGLLFFRGLLMVRQSKDFNNRIIQQFYSNLLQLPKLFFDTRKIGELIARMNDTRRIQTVLSAIAGSMVIDLLVVFVSLSFVFIYSSSMCFMMLGCLPIYFLILIMFNRSIMKSQKEVMIGYSMAESNFVDTMQGVADIKLMNKQNFFEKINAAVYNSFQQRMADLGSISIKFNWVSEVIGIAFTMAVFALASWLVLTKQLKIGQMVALIGMAGNVVPSVNRLVISNIQIQEALVAFDRMFEFTSMEKEQYVLSSTDVSNTLPIETGINDQTLALRLIDISFRFPGRKQILKGVSFALNRGEMVALLGESGGGKSTLLQLIQKFYQPESGKIMIDQNDIQAVNTKIWRDQISAVPQDVKIFNGSLLFNITLSNNEDDFQRAYHFCEFNGLSAYFNEFPQGYATLLGEEGINISGGQKQLVGLARALFRDPKILLLDEATSAMDKDTENFILTLLQKAKNDKIILLVTHRMTIAQRCDRTYTLEKGTIKKNNK